MERITITTIIIVWWTEGVGKGEFHHCRLLCSGVEKRIPITKTLWEKYDLGGKGDTGKCDLRGKGEKGITGKRG